MLKEKLLTSHCGNISLISMVVELIFQYLNTSLWQGKDYLPNLKGEKPMKELEFHIWILKPVWILRINLDKELVSQWGQSGDWESRVEASRQPLGGNSGLGVQQHCLTREEVPLPCQLSVAHMWPPRAERGAFSLAGGAGGDGGVRQLEEQFLFHIQVSDFNHLEPVCGGEVLLSTANSPN